MPNRPGGGHGRPTGPAPKAKNQKRTLFRIWQYVRKYNLQLTIVILAVILSSILTVFAPYYLGVIVDRYIIPKDIDGTIYNAVILGVIYLIISLLMWLQTFYMIKISMRVIQEIRQQLFDQLQLLPLEFFDTHQTGDLMSRVTNDVDNLNTALSQSVVQIISSVLTIIGTGIAMIYLSWQLAIASVIIIPVMFYTSKIIIKKSGKNYAMKQKDLGSLNGQIEENISGSEIITLFNVEKSKIDDFNQMNEKYRKSAMKAEITSGFLGPTNNFLNNIGLTIVIGTGAIMVVTGPATIGLLASFTTYSRQFFRPINQISNLLNTLQSAIAGAERVFEMIDEKSEFIEDHEKKKLDGVDGDIHFQNVSFAYNPSKMILQNINLEVKKGEMIAIVGPTGSGKTTLVNLLNRFYSPTEGEVFVDGQPLSQYKIGDVRKLISVVLQDTYLFSGTILDNIRFGNPEATEEQVIQASTIARAHQFIKYLPNQYQEFVQPGGVNLSQGQRQLIAIARAILEDADLLILDEATSSVDTRTESLIQEGLNALMKNKTTFVIAHRLKTIEAADQIIVLKNGEIIEKGNHRSLMENEGYYFEMQNQI